jgi:hypothetical protein
MGHKRGKIPSMDIAQVLIQVFKDYLPSIKSNIEFGLDLSMQGNEI